MVTTPERLQDIVAERLQALVPDVAAKQRLLAASGVPASTFQRMLAGKNEPQASSLMRIAEAAGVSLDWLAGLTVERDLSAAGVPIELKRVDRLPDGFVSVPVLDVEASAGSGSNPVAISERSEIVAFKEAWLRSIGMIPGRVHILWATGDSMDPTIRDGDMMLVDRTVDRVVNDGIYVVVAAGVVRVKRISLRTNGAVVLRSDNARYPEEVIPADEVPSLIVEGRVRWVGGAI